jgi:hypothetical protein
MIKHVGCAAVGEAKYREHHGVDFASNRRHSSVVPELYKHKHVCMYVRTYLSLPVTSACVRARVCRYLIYVCMYVNRREEALV